MKTASPDFVAKINTLDLFVISSVLTVVTIRSVLALSGYPQIGGDGLHIAHLLWGGLGMAITLLYLLLSDRPHRTVAAATAGVSFGFFIDEIGKFVTSDNDYFFKPAAFLMYVTILALWLVARLVLVWTCHGPLLPTAAWPSRRRARQAIVAWTAMNALSGLGSIAAGFVISARADRQSAAAASFDAVAGNWHLLRYPVAITTVLFSLGIIDYLTGRGPRSAVLIRLAALITLVAVNPFLFYDTQFGPAAGALMTAAVVFGLSERNARPARGSGETGPDPASEPPASTAGGPEPTHPQPPGVPSAAGS